MIKPWMFGTHGNLPSTTNLVGYWPLDETSGTNAPDESGNGNDGTLVNMEDADWVDGVVGKCLDFDGTNEYVEIADSANLNPTTEITLEAWIYPKATGLKYIIGKGWASPGYNLNIDPQDKAEFCVKAADAGSQINIAGTTTLLVDTWYHIVGTLGSDETARVYVNSVQENSSAWTKGINTSTDTLRIGHLGGQSEYFTGLIDEVRIYSTALTASEIKALYDYPAGV